MAGGRDRDCRPGCLDLDLVRRGEPGGDPNHPDGPGPDRFPAAADPVVAAGFGPELESQGVGIGGGGPARVPAAERAGLRGSGRQPGSHSALELDLADCPGHPRRRFGNLHTVTVAGAATDFPQFLGPNRDARLPGPRLSTDWTQHPPDQLWKQPIGLGWSSFAIAGELAVTQEQRGSRQLVVAYQLRSGKVVWVHTDQTQFHSALGGDGPRATPTISRQGRVYTLSPRGLLNCLELETGKLLWQRNIETENAAGGMRWGRSSSPLLVDDLVVVNPGGSPHRSLAAYRQLGGELVWISGNAVTSYASPTLLTLLGRPQILMVNQQMLTAHSPDDGSVLWEQAFPSGQPHCSQPVAIADDLVFVSSGYGIGSKLFRISAGEDGKYRSETVWESRGLRTKFTNTVLHKGSLYGLDEGILVCLDPETGRRRWKRGRYGHGQLIVVGDLLLITSEQGEVALVEANPERFQEVARFPALEGITWNTPALSGDLLLVRNHQEAAAYKLPVLQ